MRTHISRGRLSRTLLLLSAIDEYQCKTRHEVELLTICDGLDKQSIIDFANQCLWLKTTGSGVSLTERGQELIRVFDRIHLSQEVCRMALFDYISICRPAWANRIPYGRKEAYFFMSEDEKLCFIDAGLMTSTDQITVDWWDRVSLLFRNERDEILEDTGRIGERLTLEYENRRTATPPIWESLDSNRSGYDILSIKETGDSQTIMIEVKSSFQNIDKAEMIITRNEWDVASFQCNSDRYFFYLWLLGGKRKVAIIPMSCMKNHVPENKGQGKWETISIPFSVFRNDFLEYCENDGL